MTTHFMGTSIPVNRDYSTAWSPRNGFSPTTSPKTSASTRTSTDGLLNELGIPDQPRSRKNLWKAIGIGVVVTINVAVLVFSLWILVAVRHTQTLHNGTLNAIHGVAVQSHDLGMQNHQLLVRIKNDEAALASATQTVDKILGEAGTTSQALLAGLHQLCVAQHLTC